MTRDPKVYGLGLHHLEMQNLREFDEHPRLENIPKTHRNQCLGKPCPDVRLRDAKRLTLLLLPVAAERGDCSALALAIRAESVKEIQ
jgi:hypothetical protein